MLTRSRGVAAASAALLAVLFLGVPGAQAALPANRRRRGSGAPSRTPGSGQPSSRAHPPRRSPPSRPGGADYVARNGTRYSFADYVDPATGQVVLETDAPAGGVDPLTNLAGTATAATAEAAGRTVVRHATISDAYNRRDDIPSYYGGGGITNKMAISGGYFLCSTGFPVRNSAGVVRMVTAGHCFPNRMVVLAESRAHTEGKVSGRHLDSISHDHEDMELIGGQS